MKKIFKYGPIFDAAIVCLILGLGLWCMFIYNCVHRNSPPDITAVALTTANVRCDARIDTGIVNKGESAHILGAKQSANTGMEFFIETNSGNRGWVPQEAFDNQAIVCLKLDDRYKDLNLSVGDTVTVLGKDSKKKTYHIRTRDGVEGDVKYGPLFTVLGTALDRYCIDYHTGYVSTLDWFNKHYREGMKLSELNGKNKVPYTMHTNKNITKVLYEMELFDKRNGRVYTPAVTFDNGVMTSYELFKMKKRNTLFLKCLPGVKWVFHSLLISK